MSALRCVVFLQKRLMSFVYKGGFNFLEISLYGNWQLNVITMYKYTYTYNIWHCMHTILSLIQVHAYRYARYLVLIEFLHALKYSTQFLEIQHSKIRHSVW